MPGSARPIDKHVQISDYVTKYSGIRASDLDPTRSTKHLTTLKSTNLKLRYLVDRGVTFVGHGLSNDLRLLNLVVPADQLRDTVQLFHLPRQRMISLRFLAWHFLGEYKVCARAYTHTSCTDRRIQSETHDSAEDASAALQLYEHYTSLGSGDIDGVLRALYDKGHACSWRTPFE